MNISGLFLLPEDVEFVGVKTLPEEQRRLIEASDGDYAVTRLRGRSRSKVIDAEMADLLGEFKGGRTIVDAVLAFCQGSGHEPEATLEAAYPVLEELIHDSFLVLKGSAEAVPVGPGLKQGEIWAGMEVVRAVQVFEDSEIYQAKTSAAELCALKIARSGLAVAQLVRMISREARILEHLSGDCSPRVVAHGEYDGRPYLASQWCDGVDGARAAARLRSLYGKEGRRRLLDLCVAIAEAYARLHEQNVIHGDAHPRNLIISENNKVTIIDFGYARLTGHPDGDLSRAPRGSFGFFFEPEFAAASLGHGTRSVPTSLLGEQHIVAHMIYQLLTGHGYAEFSVERERSLRQLADSKPEPFARWGLDPWPDVEEILLRALARNPQDRYGSMEDFTQALRSATVPEPVPRELPSPPSVVSPLSDRLLSDYLRRFDPSGPLFASGLPDPPYASINFGSGGVAYFLYRMACIRNDAGLLSWAKLWIERAVNDAATKGELAFTNQGEITREIIGPIALYHTATGLHAVKALVGHARGDMRSEFEGLTDFAREAQGPCENIDLTLGSSGVLLGCALLDEAMPAQQIIRSLGDALLKEIWGRIESMPAIVEEKQFRFTGIAHGWAGVLYAVLAWCRATESKPPQSLADRLEQLADLAEPAEAGVHWESKVRPGRHRDLSDFFPSWCNGTGGMIHLWTLAHQMFGSDRYLELAEGSAWNVIEADGDIDQICCGRPGQAYGVLNLFKHTGESRWLGHAKVMAEESLRLTIPPHGSQVPSFYYGLYKGPLGSALLSADMETPAEACMPMFESEGW